MQDARSFQEQMGGNRCWGCGPDNEAGLGIRSYRDGDEAIARWRPRAEHVAGPANVLNGGIIAALIDCHAVCTAYAAGFRQLGRPVGSDPTVWFVTGSLSVTYLRPTPLGTELTVRTRIVETVGRRMRVSCSLSAAGEECARGEVVAVWVTRPTDT